MNRRGSGFLLCLFLSCLAVRSVELVTNDNSINSSNNTLNDGIKNNGNNSTNNSMSNSINTSTNNSSNKVSNPEDLDLLAEYRNFLMNEGIKNDFNDFLKKKDIKNRFIDFLNSKEIKNEFTDFFNNEEIKNEFNDFLKNDQLNNLIDTDSLKNDAIKNDLINTDFLKNDELNDLINADFLKNDELNDLINADFLKNDELNDLINADFLKNDSIKNIQLDEITNMTNKINELGNNVDTAMNNFDKNAEENIGILMKSLTPEDNDELIYSESSINPERIKNLITENNIDYNKNDEKWIKPISIGETDLLDEVGNRTKRTVSDNMKDMNIFFDKPNNLHDTENVEQPHDENIDVLFLENYDRNNPYHNVIKNDLLNDLPGPFDGYKLYKTNDKNHENNDKNHNTNHENSKLIMSQNDEFVNEVLDDILHDFDHLVHDVAHKYIQTASKNEKKVTRGIEELSSKKKTETSMVNGKTETSELNENIKKTDELVSSKEFNEIISEVILNDIFNTFKKNNRMNLNDVSKIKMNRNKEKNLENLNELINFNNIVLTSSNLEKVLNMSDTNVFNAEYPNRLFASYLKDNNIQILFNNNNIENVFKNENLFNNDNLFNTEKDNLFNTEKENLFNNDGLFIEKRNKENLENNDKNTKTQKETLQSLADKLSTEWSKELKKSIKETFDKNMESINGSLENLSLNQTYLNKDILNSTENRNNLNKFDTLQTLNFKNLPQIPKIYKKVPKIDSFQETTKQLYSLFPQRGEKKKSETAELVAGLEIEKKKYLRSSRDNINSSGNDDNLNKKKNSNKTNNKKSYRSSSNSSKKGDIPLDLVVSFIPEKWNVELPDTTQDLGTHTLIFPNSIDHSKTVVQMMKKQTYSTPYSITGVTDTSPAESKSSRIFVDFKPLQGDVIFAESIQDSFFVSVTKFLQDGTIQEHSEYELTDHVSALFDSFWKPAGSMKPWMLSDVFPFNGHNFVDVLFDMDRETKMKIKRLEEPHSIANPSYTYEIVKLDQNIDFIGLFQHFFGDQIKKENIKISLTTEKGNIQNQSQKTTSNETINLLNIQVPKGFPITLPIDFTTGLQNYDYRQFRKGQPGEVIVP